MKFYEITTCNTMLNGDVHRNHVVLLKADDDMAAMIDRYFVEGGYCNMNWDAVMKDAGTPEGKKAARKAADLKFFGGQIEQTFKKGIARIMDWKGDNVAILAVKPAQDAHAPVFYRND